MHSSSPPASPATEGAALGSAGSSGGSLGLLKREGVAHGGGSPTTPTAEGAALGSTGDGGDSRGHSGGMPVALKANDPPDGAATCDGWVGDGTKANDPPDGVATCDDGVGDGNQDGGGTHSSWEDDTVRLDGGAMRSSREGDEAESEDPKRGMQLATRQAMIGARADQMTCAAQARAARARGQGLAKWARRMPIKTCAC